MKNLKLELFNFRKNLSLDQEEVSVIVEGHMNACNDHSEKVIISSLNEKLKAYKYDKDVKSLLENLNDDMKNYELLYELKNLYNVLNSKNQGELYRQPINVLLQTINLDSDQDRMSKILNELAVYDWVPEVKLFVHNLTTSPEKRSNLLSGGKGESVYSLVESVEDGHIALIKDSWFLLTENTIEKTLLENHIKDEKELMSLRTLETAMKYSSISEDRINFRISEYLTLGLSVANKGGIFINDDELNEDTTLESLFNSPIVPIVNKNFYPILLEVSQNLDKFVELDVVKKIGNLINPYLECFAFNYKNNTYLYRCDERYGNSFFKYESALELVNEVRNELNYDLTYFYENKLSKETVVKRKLEDKEREISLKLEDVSFNIEKIKGSIKMIGESEVLTTALSNLEKREGVLKTELEGVKELQYKERIKL
jgi:translation elongation factor EF-1beta